MRMHCQGSTIPTLPQTLVQFMEMPERSYQRTLDLSDRRDDRTTLGGSVLNETCDAPDKPIRERASMRLQGGPVGPLGSRRQAPGSWVMHSLGPEKKQNTNAGSKLKELGTANSDNGRVRVCGSMAAPAPSCSQRRTVCPEISSPTMAPKLQDAALPTFLLTATTHAPWSVTCPWPVFRSAGTITPSTTSKRGRCARFPCVRLICQAAADGFAWREAGRKLAAKAFRL